MSSIESYIVSSVSPAHPESHFEPHVLGNKSTLDSSNAVRSGDQLGYLQSLGLQNSNDQPKLIDSDAMQIEYWLQHML